MQFTISFDCPKLRILPFFPLFFRGIPLSVAKARSAQVWARAKEDLWWKRDNEKVREGKEREGGRERVKFRYYLVPPPLSGRGAPAIDSKGFFLTRGTFADSYFGKAGDNFR